MTKPGKMFRVVSDGKALGTKVFWPDGKPMGLVQSITIRIDVNEPYADITQLNIEGIEISTVPIAAEMDVKIPQDNVTVNKVNPPE